MTDDAAREKWDAIYREKSKVEAQPCALLHDFAYLLPARGSALDIASGAGGNALFLARRGLQTTAMDISSVAMQNLARVAQAQGLHVQCEVADFTQHILPANSYDVITISHYLERSLAPQIVGALRPGGLLFYQTFVQEVIDEGGPKNPQFRLAPNELLAMFRELYVVYYRDEGRVGDFSQGFRNSAQLIAQRRV